MYWRHVNQQVEALSSKKVIKKYTKNEVRFKTLKGRAKVDYDDGAVGVGVTANIRIEDGKAIWISISKLGFLGAKALITPTKLSYYNKLDRTYFEGDFSLLTKLLGTELNYKQVQNMLMGEAIFDLEEERYKSQLVNKQYRLQPEVENSLYNLMFLITANSFKMAEQRLTQQAENRVLSISYPEFEKVNGQIIPKEILIIAQEDTSQTKIAFSYRSVSLNEAISFPFKIPSGYKELIIE